MTSTAALLALGFWLSLVATCLVGVLVVFAVLESALGWCAGCAAFARLMDWGLIPQETCEACADISAARA